MDGLYLQMRLMWRLTSYLCRLAHVATRPEADLANRPLQTSKESWNRRTLQRLDLLLIRKRFRLPHVSVNKSRNTHIQLSTLREESSDESSSSAKAAV
jgi:hypothetical protein